MANSLNSMIHRDLIRRLIITAAVFSVVIAALTYFLERDRVLNETSSTATLRAEQINPIILDFLDDPENLDTDLLFNRIRNKTGPIKLWSGYFPVLAIYNLQGDLLGQSIDANHPDSQKMLASISDKNLLKSPGQETRAEAVRVAGRPVVHIGLPLFDRHGMPAVQVVGVYALSDDLLSAFNRRMQRNILIAIALVVLCTTALYPVVLGLIRRVEKLSLSLLDANLATIQTLGGAIAKRDSDTDAHNYRVTLYSVRLAEAIGVENEKIRGLIKGAFLHDVGKIGIEDRVLLKPGKLDDAEFSVMRQHVNHGIDIVERAAWLDDAVPIVGCHHEKYDGTGYPDALKGEEIPIEARIFAIVDVFDALTSVRPYKDAFSLARSIEILQEGRDSHFDPQLLDQFIDLAPDLHERFANDESDRVRSEVAAVVNKYYPRDETT